MKNRKKLISLLAGIMAAILLLGLLAGALPARVFAESSAEIRQKINNLKEEKKQIEDEIIGLNKQITDNMSEMERIVAQKQAIDQEVFLLIEKVDNINSQIKSYNDLIAEKQGELDEAQEHLTALNEKNKERIRAMEEDGQISYWSVLFKANSFSDLLDRLNMVQEIAASDQRRLAEMNEAAKAVEAAKTALAEEKSNLQDMREELSAAKAEEEAKREEAEKLLRSLVEKGLEYQELLDVAEDEMAEMMAQISKLNSAYDEAKDREYKQWLASQPATSAPGDTGSHGSSVVVNGETWLLPINYTSFTSPFGYRTHPIYGGTRFHYGVDLSAPQGTPIYASRSGQVTTATYGSSGGWYVVVNHMDGYTSWYLHMTHFVVSAGQYVSAGQLLGYCGSTGDSTGPHLHFAIYKNGTAVNPALYIPI